jgi:hypothetical protein
MKYISLICFLAIVLVGCNAPKTIIITNKLKTPITLSLDSGTSLINGITIKDSLDGKRITKSLLLNFGPGKWTNDDKAALESIMKNTKMMMDGSAEKIPLPPTTKVRHISLRVEELWVNIK